MDYKTVGLKSYEYKRLKELLGREPNDLELQIIGVMWSEHCSYKSTKSLLRLFPNKGERVVLGPGENAGIINAGDGWGVAFKVESHNHPSAVAPYQGSATGVGGIIRDIIALGARPVASMDGLFFGDPETTKTKNLSDGIVKGIGGYGNCIGVPTVGGKTVYDKSYQDNPLVNAMCLGMVRLDEIVSSQTALPGQKVMIIGSKTGRDGIAGAAFASAELSEDTKSSRPSIQIGDPFVEKLLTEACLEMRDRGLLASMQDMGAAGILSSSSEIAAKSGIGMTIEFDKVPLRVADMEPWEIALSESQERMLVVAEEKNISSIVEIAERWGLNADVIGDTTVGDTYTIFWHGNMVAELPASIIGGECPEVSWPAQKPQDLEQNWDLDLDDIPLPENWNKALLSLISNHSLADKSWIYEQYDSMVQTNTVTGPGSPVSVIRIKGSDSLVAISMEADPWKCALDPYRGAAETVARSVRALAVSGAKAVGLTDCLNFPSPEKPDQFWVLQESVKGMADACRDLKCPVVSGNVSLYNETPSGKILPTPLVGTVGLVDNEKSLLPSGNWHEGDHVIYIGIPNPSVAGSHYFRLKADTLKGRPLLFCPELERDFQERALSTAHNGLAHSGRVVAGGGLAITLAREAVNSNIGAQLKIQVPTRRDVYLFGEGSPRAVYAVSPDMLDSFLSVWSGFCLLDLGRVEGQSLIIDDIINLDVDEMNKAGRRI